MACEGGEACGGVIAEARCSAAEAGGERAEHLAQHAPRHTDDRREERERSEGALVAAGGRKGEEDQLKGDVRHVLYHRAELRVAEEHRRGQPRVRALTPRQQHEQVGVRRTQQAHGREARAVFAELCKVKTRRAWEHALVRPCFAQLVAGDRPGGERAEAQGGHRDAQQLPARIHVEGSGEEEVRHKIEPREPEDGNARPAAAEYTPCKPERCKSWEHEDAQKDPFEESPVPHGVPQPISSWQHVASRATTVDPDGLNAGRVGPVRHGRVGTAKLRIPTLGVADWSIGQNLVSPVNHRITSVDGNALAGASCLILECERAARVRVIRAM